MNTLVTTLNEKLIIALDDSSLGLANGKMGYCIYFYQNKKYEIIARKLLDDIFQQIDTVDSINMKSGLSGIALGIDYLLKQKFVVGNVNFILQDIDNIIFKRLSNSKFLDQIDSLSLIQVLHYLCIRIETHKKK